MWTVITSYSIHYTKLYEIKIISALTDNEEGFLVAQEIAQNQLRNHYQFQDFASYNFV